MIGFRRLTREDLLLMHRWLNTDHVRRWWGEGFDDVSAVATKYLDYITGRKPTDPYVILADETPIGYIQTYLIRDYPDYELAIGVGGSAAGLDLFIGEPAYLYRGWGPRILTAFLDEIVFARQDVTSCVVGPAVSNASAVRAYEKAGFRSVSTVDVPGEAEPENVLQIDRADRPNR